jgi:uncharacterized protein YbjQ (UPF0145 family)
MEISTIPTLEGQRIVRYCGGGVGEATLGANFIEGILANIRDFAGRRSGAYEKELRKARRLALDELAERAVEQGANAAIGVDLDYEVLGEKNSTLMVTASGIAVVVE